MSATPEGRDERVSPSGLSMIYGMAGGDDAHNHVAWDAVAREVNKAMNAAIAAHVAARVGEERERHMKMHHRANDLLRSCLMVADREMDRPNSTSWDALRKRLRDLLALQRDFDVTIPTTPEARDARL
jgi:hypothetical protein